MKNDVIENSGSDIDSLDLPEELPLIPLSDFVVYPLMVLPMTLSLNESVNAADAAMSGSRMVLLLAERDSDELPGSAKGEDKDGSYEDRFYKIGTAASILRTHKLSDGRSRVIVQGLTRIRVNAIKKENGYLIGEIEKVEEVEITEDDTEVIAWVRNIRESLEKAASYGKVISPEIMLFASNVEEPGRLADLAAATIELDVDDAQKILEETEPLKRLKRVFSYYSNELQILEMQNRISMSAKGEMEKSHKEYFLRQQLKAIQQELGDANEYDDEIGEIRERIIKAKMPDDAHAEAERQLEKLERMHPDASEASVIRNYLEVMVDLPWSKSTNDRLDLIKAKEILDQDHYDLEKVKERILEHLGVMKLKKGKMRGPILCFVGPPGVGKTSLGRSIARALRRKFFRLSLGGVRDEAEVRGHRRTYVGAMPGRIIQGVNQVSSNNPVYMMDEVDKIGQDFRGDPSSALLEVLDPEQNSTFRDNYLGVDFDLSKVMFILTANRLDTIQPAFRDRMEIIELPGYAEEDKVHIANNYLLKKQRREAGITANQLQIDDDTLKKIIRGYTSEAGVRSLERQIAAICRKVARKVAEGKRGRVVVTPENLEDFLGPIKNLGEQMLETDTVGVATGLAWTPAGGDVLFIEAILMKGKGNLTLTGQLGEIMQESAKAGLSYLKANAEQFELSNIDFAKHDLHIHVPEGAIPKDGPSAGVSMITSMISAYSGKPVRRDVALTGEISLRGRVMPVGGIKEKVLAARRLGIKEIILPKQNEKDLVEIQENLRKEITFHFAESVDDVVRIMIPSLVSE
jgi:ATP-dependent Lon protease